MLDTDAVPLVDAARFSYPGHPAYSALGFCRLRVFRHTTALPGGVGLVAIVTDLGDDNPGPSITNASAGVDLSVRTVLDPLTFLLIEHYPDDRGRRRSSFSLASFNQHDQTTTWDSLPVEDVETIIGGRLG